MSEEEAKNWIKDKTNQQAVLTKILKGAKQNGRKYAVFMAGIPGAGKTEFVRNSKSKIIKDAILIEHDQLVEHIKGYSPENYYDFRKAGSILVTKLFDACLKQGMSFVFDGTLSHENGRRNIAKCIKNGYAVLVIYVHQDAKSAWQLTKSRELTKKRAIEKTGFIHTCSIINQNLREIFEQYHTSDQFTFWIIMKNGSPGLENSKLVVYDNAEKKGTMKEVESILTKAYNVSELEG